MKTRFPYDPPKFVAGLLISWLIGSTLTIILALLSNDNWFPMARITSIYKAGFFCFVPILTICSLSWRRYWVIFIVYVIFIISCFVFAALVLLPRPAGTTVFQQLWRTKESYYQPIIIYYIPALFFRQYCIWVCNKPDRQSEGAHDE